MKKILFVPLVVLCLLITSYFLLIISAKAFSHHFSYYHVSENLLGDRPVYVVGTKERQFISYTPFPYTLAKPEAFSGGNIIAFKKPNSNAVMVAEIILRNTNGNTYQVLLDNEEHTEITIEHKWIIAKD